MQYCCSVLADSTLGHNEDVLDQLLGFQQYFRVTVFTPVVDQLVAEIDRQFGADENRTPLLKGIAASHSEFADFISICLCCSLLLMPTS